jgi:hypothetical protein
MKMYLLKNLRKFKTKNEKVSRNFKPQLHMVRENDPKKNFPRFTVYVIFYLFIFFQLNRVNKMCVIQIISFSHEIIFLFSFLVSNRPHSSLKQKLKLIFLSFVTKTGSPTSSSLTNV